MSKYFGDDKMPTYEQLKVTTMVNQMVALLGRLKMLAPEATLMLAMGNPPEVFIKHAKR